MSISLELKTLIDSHDTISFDIFDTLVHRLVFYPNSIFSLVELQIRYLNINSKLSHSFSILREEAERIAQREKNKYEGSREVSIDEIYDILSELSGVPLVDLIQVLQLEKQTESNLIYADPEMKEAFLYAQQQNKKIIITSDMYYSQEDLKTFLYNVGIDASQAMFYISCEKQHSKITGGLFNKIIEDLGIPANTLLHIGDNEQRDIIAAKTCGISTYFYGLSKIKSQVTSYM